MARLLILFCFLFGASHAIAGMLNEKDVPVKSSQLALDIHHPLNHDTNSSEETVLVRQSIARAVLVYTFPAAALLIVLIAILIRPSPEQKAFPDRVRPVLRLPGILFRVIISPNAP